MTTEFAATHPLEKFGRDRLVLIGHSWGTVIGALSGVWFENSAHLPNAEERDRVNQVMREDVRPLALATA